MKTTVIRFHETGEPSVLRVEEAEIHDPSESEVQIEQKAIGVNYIDTYFRTGLYPTAFPSGLGFEASGIVIKTGKTVSHLKTGDRVAYCQGPLGAYATVRNVPANFVVRIPDNVTFEDAASVMLKGLTVHYLFQTIYPPKKNEKFLFHAAAGGVGLIACQWARHLGAAMIGTVSSDEKAELAKQMGASDVINYRKENIVSKVLEITNGQKVSVVFDCVGNDTWETSLDCLSPRGLMVSFGNASGPVTNVNLGTLAQKGSLFVTRPMLWNYFDTPEKLRAGASELFSMVERKIISPGNVKHFRLEDASLAHSELLSRGRAGGLLLTP